MSRSYSVDNPPSAEEYRLGLEALRHELNQDNVRVLQLQYSRPGRRISSQEIRDEFGYRSIGASNLLYGKTASRIAKHLRFETRLPGDAAARTHYWRALSTGDDSGRNFAWVMRPQLALALEAAGVVEETVLTAPSIDLDLHDDLDSGSSPTAIEGRQKLVQHIERERSRGLVDAKKRAAKVLACEVCGFDFAVAYGELGKGYCEAHHLVPLSELDAQRETRLEDLALLCANCHRVVHRQCPPYTLDQLRQCLVPRT